MSYPMNDNEYESIKKSLLVSRGFRFGDKDGDGEYSTKQPVRVRVSDAGGHRYLPGCGTLNGILIRDAQNRFPMVGAVQYGNTNAYYPMADIEPATFLEYAIQPKAFGRTPWSAFWVTMAIATAISSVDNWSWWPVDVGALGAFVLGAWMNWKGIWK